MTYKVKVVYRNGDCFSFKFDDYEIANIFYERYCLKFADNASTLEGEYLIAMINEENTIMKQLKLISTK